MELSLAKPAGPALVMRKPSLLKDFLLDDLSSCSSSGFRSYPRRQCCASVRFLLETDLKSKPPKYMKKPPPPPKTPSLSAFKRASAAVVNAVKSSSSLSNKLKLTLLTKSLSQKLLKRRSFWKKPDRKEIQHWEPPPSNIIQPSLDFPVSPASGGSLSSSTTSDSNCKSYIWSDSDFTVSSSGGNNSTVEVNSNRGPDDVVSSSTRNFKKGSSKRVGGTTGGADAIEATSSSSSSNNLKQCQSGEEEKEQFSPISVLECPFDDDDEVSSSPFQHRLARMEGTKKRLMRKIKKFERLTQLEPLNLQNRILSSESDPDSDRSPNHRRSSESSLEEDFIDDSEEEENPSTDKPFKLLQITKSALSGVNPKSDCDNLLLDFFKEGTEPGNAVNDHELVSLAKDWVIGSTRELFLGWEVPKNRDAYVKDMERAGNWRNYVNDEEEKKEVAMELEVEVFGSLVNELCHDLLSSS